MIFRRRRLRLILDLFGLSESQAELIEHQQGTIEAMVATIERMRRDNVDTQLSYSRIGRDLIQQFLIVLDQPETQDEVRDRLAASLRDFNDEVARLEEQTS